MLYADKADLLFLGEIFAWYEKMHHEYVLSNMLNASYFTILIQIKLHFIFLFEFTYYFVNFMNTEIHTEGPHTMKLKRKYWLNNACICCFPVKVLDKNRLGNKFFYHRSGYTNKKWFITYMKQLEHRMRYQRSSVRDHHSTSE